MQTRSTQLVNFNQCFKTRSTIKRVKTLVHNLCRTSIKLVEIKFIFLDFLIF